MLRKDGYLEGNDNAVLPKFDNAILPDEDAAKNYRYRHYILKMQDAFIEKAEKWFEECFMNVHRWEISTYEFENIQSMIDEFRKYMEGE